jgi:hypothetical protein
MKKLGYFSLLTIAWCVAITPASATADKEGKRDLLANHETVAMFDGVEFVTCRGLTSRCPKDCGSSGEYAKFVIEKYLKYEKPGQYGDPKQKNYSVQVTDYYKKSVGDSKIRDVINNLKKGDYVLLSWHHDYVTAKGASFPERTVTKLERITKAQADTSVYAGETL